MIIAGWVIGENWADRVLEDHGHQERVTLESKAVAARMAGVPVFCSRTP